jgi:hypothetical protein
MRSPGRAILAAVVAAATAAGAGAAVTTVKISGVPAYTFPWEGTNYPGCGPIAAGMITGYWDDNGFADLIPLTATGDGTNSWTTNQADVKTMIASAEHKADYWGYGAGQDRVPPPPWHADNCVADFMQANRGSLADGDSAPNKQPDGLGYYAEYRGYLGSYGYNVSYSATFWDLFRGEIDAGRPMELYVDSDGSGAADHFLTAFGYEYDPLDAGYRKYICYNTWDLVEHVYDFTGVAAGQLWGIHTGTVFMPMPEPLTLTLVAAGAAALMLRRGRTGTQSGRGPRPAARRGPEGTNGDGLRRRTKGNGDRA